MNFMRDNHPFKKLPNRRRKKTINFFQTVREGKRSFTSGRGIPDEEKNAADIPWMQGRRFIQPSRRTSSSSKTETGTDVKTILSNLEQQSHFGSSAADDKLSNIYTVSSLDQPSKKKNKSFSNWTTSIATKQSETSSSSRPNHISTQECFSSICRVSREDVSSSTKGQKDSSSSEGQDVGRFLSASPKRQDPSQGNNKQTFFDLEPAGSNMDAFTESFFKSSIEDKKDSTSRLKGFFKDPSKNMPSVTECFFKEPSCDPKTQETFHLSHESFFNRSEKEHVITTSSEGFFKTPLPKPQKSKSNNQGFFQLSAMLSPKNTNNVGFNQASTSQGFTKDSNEIFFKVPTTKPQKSNANQQSSRTPTVWPQNATNESFFKIPDDPKRSSSNKEFFDLKALKTHYQIPNEGFFRTSEQPPGGTGSLEEFFNTPTQRRPMSQNEKEFNFLADNNKNPTPCTGSSNEQTTKPGTSVNYEEIFKTPKQPKPSTSFDNFFQPEETEPVKTTSNDMFKTPTKKTKMTPNNQINLQKSTAQSQKTPRYDEFLKPQLNPKILASQKDPTKIVDSNSSSTGNYDDLFKTPSKIRSLPKMTTPHLFKPFEKPPSRTSATPASKSNSKTTNKTPLVSNEDSTYFVISVTEGRGCAICDIGLAAIDLKSPNLILSQFSDIPTYKKLLTKINLLDAAELLMPETFSNSNPSEMYKKVTETFTEVRVTTAKRVQFSAKNGLESIRQLMLPDDSSLEVIVCKKYYALAAAEALLRYIEVKHNVLFSPKTLRISFESAKDAVALDYETCQRLELVSSNANVLFPEQYSLFGVLNFTKTIGGKRRLRTNLMQPSSSSEQLEKRLVTVSALVNNQAALASLQNCLLKFSSVERILWLSRKTPNFRNEANTFDTLTNYILLLKGCLEGVAPLRKVLKDIDDDHIIDIRNELHDENYELMLKHMKKMIRDDARLTKGYASSSRERCYAIKEGFNDLLDVARATYSELVEHVLKMVTELAEEYCLPLKMTQTHDMGFHASYVLPRKIPFKKEDVPEIFTEVKSKNRTVHLLTDEMFNLNVRINRAMEEIQLITNVVIYDLVESLKEGISCLYRLCDRVAELDLLSSLAQASSTPDYVRPVFGSQMSLVGARHPILDHLCRTKPIPNNFNASRSSNFTIITGPNMSGKTVYVLTVPLIHIMAQVGCYVPADKAELRITDHIYVRKGTVDNMQNRLSSHGSEMKELSYTLKILTDRSLIILDELCTSCSCQKGICLAWAFSEEFLKTSCFTFLTTHYHYLCNLSRVYKNVKNFHMEAIEKTPKQGESYWDLTFTFRLLPGNTQMTDYALRLMMASALPDEVKQYALAVAKDIAQRRESSLPVCVVDDPEEAKELAQIEKIENFMFNLKALSMTDKFTPKMIRSLQKMIREEILPDMGSDDEISLEETEESPLIVEEHTPVTVEAQKVIDEAVNEFLKGEQEDQTDERNSELIHQASVESSRRGREPQAQSKSGSADNMASNENIKNFLREEPENCNFLLSNIEEQEPREEGNEEHCNRGEMYSNQDELIHLTTENVRSVPNEENVEPCDEGDEAILYSRMEDLKNKNHIRIEDEGAYDEDFEERDGNLLYPGRYEQQNFMNVNDEHSPADQGNYGEQKGNYGIEYLDRQHNPPNMSINNRSVEGQILEMSMNENANSSDLKRTGESTNVTEFKTAQKLPNIFSIGKLTYPDDEEDFEEDSDSDDSSSSSSEGSYYINNNLP